MQSSQCRRQPLGHVRRALAMPACCALLVIVAFAVSSCSRARAQTVPDGPPLAVPLPPAHEIVVEQIAEAPPPEPELVAEPEVVPPPRPAAARAPARKEPPADAAASTQAPNPPPAADAPAVRATPTAAAADDERKVRALLAKASTALNRVNYQRLSTDGRSQYDQSKQFSKEAEQAIKERNFLLALTLADKAATIASELAGR